MHKDPKGLDKNLNYLYDNDVEVQSLLMHFGMLGGIPTPPCSEGQGACGHALYQDHSKSFFLVVIRSCVACDDNKEKAYAALLISKKQHSPKEAFTIRDKWLTLLSGGRKLRLEYLEFPAENRN